MAGEIVKAKLDVVFKMMFTDKNNEKLLRSFIADVLEIPYESITKMVIENSEITPEELDRKFTRFDLKLTTDAGLINVEVQVTNRGDFPERGLYYWAQRYSGQLKKGDTYGDIKPTISIYIVNFKMFDTDSYCSTYTMADLEHHNILTDKCAMHFFELPKLDGECDPKNKKKLWMQLINSESEEELAMLNNTMVPEIQNGVSIIHRLSADKDVRAIAVRREEALREELSALDYALRQGRKMGIEQGIEEGIAKGREEGIAKGREEGRAEAINALLAKLRAMGVDEKTIQEAARLN
ncbi:MAG: Rpn family recombination-promoting nuclease/putative transposase [Candidatus Ornithomonoglobus sp.]